MIAALLLLLAPQSAPDASRQVAVTNFERVRVTGPFTVEIVAGSPRASVTGAAAALGDVRVAVEGSVLLVAPVRDDRNAPRTSVVPPRIRIQVPALRAASLIGGGALSIERMAGARIDLTLTGPGSITVAQAEGDQLAASVIGSGKLTLGGGKARTARFMVNGSGDVDAGGLVADNLTVRQEGPGNGRYAARYVADVTGLGSGSIDVAGQPRCRTSGTATIRCEGVR